MSIPNISKYLVSAILVAMFASCSSDPKKPGKTYMPDMAYSQAYETYTVHSYLGADSMEARLPVKGTIPYGSLPADSLANDKVWHESYLYRTYFPEADTASYERAGRELRNPLANNEEILKLGQDVYTVNCAICHGETGDGKGNIVVVGAYPPVPAYKERLSTINEGKMFHSITYGKGLMGSYAPQVTPKERWAVIYYIQKLAKVGPFAGNATQAAAKDSTAKM
ncbi:MAG: cytochrome c [Chitinophagales bacterium]|nr:cytochrome c [Chitinophagales bacterium]